MGREGTGDGGRLPHLPHALPLLLADGDRDLGGSALHEGDECVPVLPILRGAGVQSREKK